MTAMKTGAGAALFIGLIVCAGWHAAVRAQQPFSGRWEGTYACGTHSLRSDFGPFSWKDIDFRVQNGIISGRHDYNALEHGPAFAIFSGRIDPYGNVRIDVAAQRQEGGEDFHQILLGHIVPGGLIQAAGPMLIRQNRPVRDCSLTLNVVAPPAPVVQNAPPPLPAVPHYQFGTTKAPAPSEPQQPAAPVETAEQASPSSETPDYTQTCRQYINALEQYHAYSLNLEKSDWGRTYYRADPSTLVGHYTSYDLRGASEPLLATCYSLAREPAFSFAEITQNVSGGKVLWCLLPGKVIQGDCPLTNEHPIILSDAGGKTGRETAVMRCIMSAVHKTDQIARLRSTMSAGDPARVASANDIENLTMSARDICEKNPNQIFQ